MHIGNIIKDKLSERNITIVEFAKELNIHRSNVYRLFEKSSIDVILLMKISKIVKFNFLDEISTIVADDLK